MSDKVWIKLSSIYIGTVIGAGFASGQEIIQFFGVYGFKGIFGVILATFLFSFIGALVLLNVYKKKIHSYDEIIIEILGDKMGIFLNIVVTLFLYTGYCVMLAGSGAIFYEQFGISYDLGIYFMAIATMLTFLFNVKGISTINTFIVPLLLLGITATGISVILSQEIIFSNYLGAQITKTGNWISSALFYVSYNSISATVIMASLLPLIPNERIAIKGGVFGGLGLGVLAIFILVPLLMLYTNVYNIEIPMLKISEYLGPNGRFIYSIVLWGAMFTTAVSNGYGVIKKISHSFKINQTILSIFFSIISIPMGRIGFSKLVTIFYPILGYMGLFILVLIIWKFTFNSN